MQHPPSLCDHVLVNIRRIMRAVDMQSRRLASECGLTGPQLLLLQRLQVQDGQATGALADAIGLSIATVSEIVDRLEKRQLVSRARSRDDNRRVLLSLTEEGREALRRAPPLIQEHFRDEFEKLQEWEKSLLLSSLQRIAAMMDASDLDAAPILVTGPIPALPSEQPPAPKR